MTRLARIAPVAALLGVLLSPPALAEGADPRMIVEVTADADTDAATLRSDIRRAAELALPVLWRRLIPADALDRAPSAARAIRLLKRALPVGEGVRVEFDARRVFALLDKAELPYIAEPPAWSVSLALIGPAGVEMRQSEALLQEELSALADRLGVVLDPEGEALILRWRWLDARQVTLLARGTTRAGEFMETRMLAGGDPLPQLAAWLEQVLRRVRDAYRIDAQPQVAPEPSDAYARADAGRDPYATALDAWLTVEGPASLPEQVLFEDDLRRAPEVAAVIPELLSAERRRYRLHLRQPGDDWLAAWLRARGLSAERGERGWLAR